MIQEAYETVEYGSWRKVSFCNVIRVYKVFCVACRCALFYNISYYFRSYLLDVWVQIECLFHQLSIVTICSRISGRRRYDEFTWPSRSNNNFCGWGGSFKQYTGRLRLSYSVIFLFIMRDHRMTKSSPFISHAMEISHFNRR